MQHIGRPGTHEWLSVLFNEVEKGVHPADHSDQLCQQNINGMSLLHMEQLMAEDLLSLLTIKI
ncbi:hypothetical protein [Paraflavitalea speifideaquila]|uniref:hypothetical protein n=1 Tax=Paraflavitalea speifideaquila TaxID=3076558 RepID=UPI0028E57231|nr:hypothetical protein [Paraflavitalea speifideiaquila]